MGLDSPRTRRPRAVALLSACVVLAAACSSSTARDDAAAPQVSDGPSATDDNDADDRDTSVTDGDGTGEATDGSEPGGATSSPGTSGSPDGSTGGSDGGTDTGSDPTTSTDGGASGSASSTSTTTGGGDPPPDVDTEPLKIGYLYYSGNTTAVIGMEDPTPSSERQDRWIRALEAQVNGTGGFAGRPIEVTIRHIDSTDTSYSTQQRIQTEACVALTEDLGVFMAIGLEGFHAATDCWIEHETPAFNMTGQDGRSDMLDMRPWILPNLWLSSPRMARLIPHSLCQRGWVNDAIGVLAYDQPQTRIAVEEHMIPAFEACGGTVLEVVYVSPEVQSISAEVSNAVLRFNQRGVNRVALFVSGGGGLVVFANAAESQNYRPLIGVSSYDRPGVFAQAIPEAQRRNLSGPGFHVGIDVSGSAMPPLRPREQECFDVLNDRAGENFQNRGNPAVDASPVLALATCDSFWAIQHALRPAAGQALARRDVIDRLFDAGSSYPPVFFERATWAPPRRDAVDAFADLVWGADCNCMRYDSEFRPIPF
ncbi:MAG TPA: hypothetical protein VGA69_11270 [Nitriliruptorales bacterium]